MEHKGWLRSDGRVSWLMGADAVAELYYKEERFNLRRMIVSRQWIAKGVNGLDIEVRGCDTRRDAVREFMDMLNSRKAAQEHT